MGDVTGMQREGRVGGEEPLKTGYEEYRRLAGGGGGERRGQTDFAIVYFSGNYIFPWKESELFSLRIYFCRECIAIRRAYTHWRFSNSGYPTREES